VLTGEPPDADEASDIAYGRQVARQIADSISAKTVVIRDSACVALRPWKAPTNHRAAARLAEGQKLVVVKVSKPRQDMRFDVPVIGVRQSK